MKRIMALSLMIVMLSCSVNASAWNLTTPSPQPTQTPVQSKKELVNVFNFCELYTQRLIEFEEQLGIEINEVGMTLYTSAFPASDDGIICANCSGGIVSFNTQTLEVVEWSDILFYIEGDEDTFFRRMSSCAVSISALEYDSLDESTIRLFDNTSPAMKAYTDIVAPLSKGLSKTLNRVFAGEQILIYQGKYDYYLSGLVSDGKRFVFITAK